METTIESVQSMPSFETTLDDLVARFTGAWWQAGSKFPRLQNNYPLREKLRREKALQAAVDGLTAELKSPAPTAVDRAAKRERMERQAIAFARDVFDFDEATLQAFLNAGFREAGLEFVRQARAFDPDLPGQEIFQAARNVWSMNLFQYLFGLPVGLTPAIFAYSLLYPYTDNYLDDPALPAREKKSANERLTTRLMGVDLAPANRHEQHIFDLIGRIESQYDRARFPLVFEGLLAIQKAQIESLKLFDPQASPYEVDVLRICLKKGGAATLADGYLVAGTLTPAQQELTFGYGAFTQFLDDQEDVSSDRQAGLMTIFSQTTAGWKLDGLVNCLFAFKEITLGGMREMEQSTHTPIAGLIFRGIDLLLIEAVGAARRYYSRPYLRALEAAFPVRFSELDRQRRRLFRQRALLAGLSEILTI